jgi:hypothetical protein
MVVFDFFLDLSSNPRYPGLSQVVEGTRVPIEKNSRDRKIGGELTMVIQASSIVAKKQNPNSKEGKQLGLRLSAELLREVEFCAEALGLEAAPFIRMVLIENLGKYKRRAERIKSGESIEE